MTSIEIREKFLNFFKAKGHTVIPSASLIPENDPSVLFTTAGMHPLVPFLLGEKHPGGQRLVNVQKCIRTGDIDEVGDSFHHTFFEMLGNWSLGDYFKKEAIEWSYEFLTSSEWLGLDKNRLAISVFAGDEDAPLDQEAYDAWVDSGIPKERIAKLPKKNNWWGMETGPCGPDSEMFYWVGPSASSGQVPEKFDDSDSLWVEIWNDVFMQFNKGNDNKLTPLAKPNVDTGMGLERTLAVVNGLDDNYRTELFWPIIQKIEELSGKKYGESEIVTRSMRIIADHLRAAVFIIGDERGIAPSNVGQGYVLRRLLRRAIRHGNLLGIKENFTTKLASVVIDNFELVYTEFNASWKRVVSELEKEEKKFRKTLEQGLREFSKLKAVTGKDAFNLYQTYGFPIEMSQELAKESDLVVNEEEFKNEFQKHQDLSRTASAGMFKGGLADASTETVRLHTAAHLMLEALRRVLGDHIQQKGSNITAERLRFDFSHGEKVTPEQIAEVEKIVNEQIQKKLPVHFEELPLEEARAVGATGVFEHKYGDKVKVYFIGNSDNYYSKEICGGPHVSNTNELGQFKIIKEESVSAGVRRIKAVVL
ncbi:MAG: alanine--tRNA ligase [Candidatus Yanofskybacteria bacterium RIFCSPLOWO2_02_FULL_45_10]|uniref:Alanine--tRNA ligase n=2 Tax=Candidatus Yanofskyibacteriota TaxID=1752733 RepID=A0A1F8G696_9BACT|nr:MAG: alanine--tRNA ligase [Candidatus Yanofskybacteria bacterium RIFCSPHIGHO2_12_FULL_45_19b]OGN31767.1 MAG: alanine--tRNA ligase [Candidatus Yanofskybacteria bacterium RIFCSPLOWO2_02_FULL_45_10]